jgi:hypothetical protein
MTGKDHRVADQIFRLFPGVVQYTMLNEEFDRTLRLRITPEGNLDNEAIEQLRHGLVVWLEGQVSAYWRVVVEVKL